MTTDQHSITNYGGVVVFNIPFASVPPEDLLPHWHDLQSMKVVADLTHAADGTGRLTVTVSSLDDSNRPPQPETVFWVIQKVWNGLVALGLAVGPMPDVVQSGTPNQLYVPVPA